MFLLSVLEKTHWFCGGAGGGQRALLPRDGGLMGQEPEKPQLQPAFAHIRVHPRLTTAGLLTANGFFHGKPPCSFLFHLGWDAFTMTTLKNWCFQTAVLVKTLESLGQQGDQSILKEINPE